MLFQRANQRVVELGRWIKEGKINKIIFSIFLNIILFRFSAISRPKSLKLSFEERMKMKADLNETRNREKQMWNVVNEKRDVREIKTFLNNF